MYLEYLSILQPQSLRAHAIYSADTEFIHSTWGAGSEGLRLLLMAHILKSCSWPPAASTFSSFFLSEETLFLRRQIHWITWSSDERRCKSYPSWDTFANDENSHACNNKRQVSRCDGDIQYQLLICTWAKVFQVSQRANHCYVSAWLLHSAPLCWLLNVPCWRKI